MHEPGASAARGGTRERLAVMLGKLLRFGTSSLVAVACSETTFLLLYGPSGTSSTVASVCAWLAGAIPNYWINRAWTWRRRGRPSLSRELVPYAAIVFGTLGLAIAATAVGDAVLRDAGVSDATRTGLVGGIYLLVYALMFLVRFFLFDHIFTRLTPNTPDSEAHASATRQARPPAAP
jgi:putative flippase GtrA